MKRCIHYPNGWYCDKTDKVGAGMPECKGCAGSTKLVVDKVGLFCPKCREDIDIEVGEFMLVGAESGPPDIMPCPHCQTRLRVKIEVEEAEDEPSKAEAEKP